MPDDEFMRGPDSLAAALAALPLETPDAGGFARLRESIERRRRRARLVRGLALAASLAAIALVPVVLMQQRGDVSVPDAEHVASASVTATGSPVDARRSALIEQNEQLEAWVRAQDEPFDGASAYASAELEDLIGALDAELTANHDDTREDALWRQRLALLDELARVRSAGVTRLATNDAGFVRASYQID